jgi:hypothetical protein
MPRVNRRAPSAAKLVRAGTGAGQAQHNGSSCARPTRALSTRPESTAHGARAPLIFPAPV